MIPATAIETREPCPACRGSGRHGHREDETCPDCDGSGRVWAVPEEDEEPES